MKNPQVGRIPPAESVLHFADGHWQETPTRVQVNDPACLGVDGQVVEGSDTELSSWSMTPESDGTLKGVITTTVLTNECGYQGLIVQAPFVATRTGEAPAGVIVADPAGVAVPPSTETRAPAATDPTLNGVFRVDYNYANQTINGRPGRRGSMADTESEWWAFRSACTPTRCAATGSGLAENNHLVTTGSAIAVEFIEDAWQNTPTLLVPRPCSGDDEKTHNSTTNWSFQPQPDGTLKGFQTSTILTDECGLKGYVYKTPINITWTGDVPPTVTVADPNLFVF